MSRVGKKLIRIPKGVEATIDRAGVKMKGPKGLLELKLHPHVAVEKKREDGADALAVTVSDERDPQDRALWGLSARLIENLVKGVTEGFEKRLEFIGVGYKVSVSGDTVKMDVGFSHDVEFKLPKGIEAKAEKNLLTLTGIDKQLIGETAARIRRIRKPEPYKGKGIRYEGEVVRRKAGKAAKATGA
jgi:large subunit ribosomal protein L6